jgi:putative peptidoglycan lipid II flippase
MAPFSTVGLAIASNVAVLVQAWYLQVRLARKLPGLAFHHLALDTAKVLVSSLLMGIVVAGGWWGWQRVVGAGRLADAAALVVLIGTGLAVYAGGVWVFRIEGREDLAAMVRRRLGRG